MAGKLRLEGNNSYYTGFESNLGLTEDVIWKLPAADGTDGQFLATDNNKNLSWASIPQSFSGDNTFTGSIIVDDYIVNPKATDNTSTGTQNAYPTTTGITYITSATTLIINGIVAKPEGTHIYLVNQTGNTLSLTNNSGVAIAENRLDMSSDKTLANKRVAHLLYVGARWMLVGAH